MKKRSNKSFLASAAYLVVALVLCAGVIFYTGNGGTGLTVADITDTMPETGTDEIVAGEEEVPLASAPKVSVKKSTKTTTKKKTLKKAAKKTKTTTKKKTSKKKSTKKTATVQTVTETTVQTTEKTSTKKKSKVQTIRTTVVTTVKTTTQTFGTTTTTTTNNAASVGASTAVSSSGFAISKFSDIKGHVDSKVYDAFVNLGFELKINSKLATTGVFSTKNHNIQLKRGQSSYLLHELGHFVSALKGRNGKKIDQSSEFTRIYNEEKSAYVGNNKAYVTQDAAEYFAESFRDYTENPSALKSQRPRACLKNHSSNLHTPIYGIFCLHSVAVARYAALIQAKSPANCDVHLAESIFQTRSKTYSYISQMVSSLSSSDVKAFRNAYGWYWSINK